MNISLLQKVIAFDKSLSFFFINSPHPLLLNLFFGLLSVKGIYIVIWFVIFLYLVFFEGKKHKTFMIYFFTSIIISTILVAVLKNIIARPRPLSSAMINQNQINQLESINYPADYSFPSGHATISFAVATILSAFDKKRKRYFYLLATLISFSRVYLGYHYVFDVISGALLGWIIVKLMLIHKSNYL